jgi:hypothetical protein
VTTKLRAQRAPLHSYAEDDGSCAHDAPEPGLSFGSRALSVEPAGVDPERAPKPAKRSDLISLEQRTTARIRTMHQSRPLFREPGSVSGAGGSRTRRRLTDSNRPIVREGNSLPPNGRRECYFDRNPSQRNELLGRWARLRDQRPKQALPQLIVVRECSVGSGEGPSA